MRLPPRPREPRGWQLPPAVSDESELSHGGKNIHPSTALKCELANPLGRTVVHATPLASSPLRQPSLTPSYRRGSPGEACRATCLLVCFRAACPQPCGDRVIFTGGKVAHLGSLTVDGGRGSVPVTPCPGQQDPTGGAGDASLGLVCPPRVSSEFCGLRVQSSGRPPEPRVGGRGVDGGVPGGRSLLMSESMPGAELHDAQPQQAPRWCHD